MPSISQPLLPVPQPIRRPRIGDRFQPPPVAGWYKTGGGRATPIRDPTESRKRAFFGGFGASSVTGGRNQERGRMTTSRRLADRKVAKFEKNVTKRGFVPESTTKKGTDYPVGPIMLGFFVFVVIGSSLFQIIRTAASGGMA